MVTSLSLHWISYAAVLLAAICSGAVNAVAAGGILLTFPVLVAIGLTPIAAIATSTLALWPGNVSSVIGYRRELAGSRAWAIRFAAPSLLGGAAGAFLLLLTPAARFDAIVPFLVLGATLLFLAQPVLLRWLRTRVPPSGGSGRVWAEGARAASRSDQVLAPPPAIFLLIQFAVAVYGGYFGAGAGILMLASLGLMGLTNIHQMNGLKNWGALCFNFVAAVLFVAAHRVQWPMALTMSVGSVIGAYGTSGIAQRLPQSVVRATVVVAGCISAAWLLLAR